MKTFKRGIAGKMLTVAMVISLTSCLTLFSSCVATVRTPSHVRTGIVIESDSHDNGNHYGEKKHKHHNEYRY
jgi:hypothetical protein